LGKIDGLFLAHRLTDTALLFFEIKAALIDIGDQGYGLSKVDMDGFVLGYFLIKSVRDFDRAVFDTGRATRAPAFDNVSGFFSQCDPEVSFVAFDTVNFGITQDLYVRMPADLDQFWREYSDGTLIGREGLVQLGHLAADGGALINQVNFKARIAKVECGLHTADSPADDHDVPKIIVSESLTQTAREAFTNLVFDDFSYFFHFYPHSFVLITLISEEDDTDFRYHQGISNLCNHSIIAVIKDFWLFQKSFTSLPVSLP
jgi:hypothetical protein